MKILMATDSLDKGGKERRLLELLKGLQSYGHISCELVLFSKRVYYKEIFDMDIPIHYLERKPKKDPRVFFRFFQLCKELKPDIIHSWGSMPSVYALPASEGLGIKLVNAMITNAPSVIRFYEGRFIRSKLTFPFSDAIVSNSYAGLESYHAPKKKSFCLHNGFDFKRIANLADPEEIRHKFSIQTPHIVGMVGAFADRKDYKTYIRTAILLLQKRDDVTFLAIGDGKNLPESKMLLPEKFSDRFLFTGLQDKVESIINTFSVGVLSTNQDVHGEGISNAILEYMAIGKPVVATLGGGTAEIVADGETGFLVDPKNPKMMAEKIAYLLDHPEEAQQMGDIGHNRIVVEFNLKDMAEKYNQLYQQVMSN